MQEALQIKSESSAIAPPFDAHDPTKINGKCLALEVFPCLLDIGEAMLKCGADVHYVEEKVSEMGKAYGAIKMNVLVITAAVVVTMTLPGGHERTLTRRVLGESGINFDKLESLSHMCDACIANPVPLSQLQDELTRIVERPLPTWALYLGGILSAGGFAIFFGGGWIDGLVSALFAIVICYAIKHFKPWTPNAMIFNFISSLIVGMGITLVAHFVPSVSTDMVMIGDIMLLIPGVAMTNATRDMLSGDTISGVMRFIESLLWATSLALGFMAAIWVAGMVN